MKYALMNLLADAAATTATTDAAAATSTPRSTANIAFFSVLRALLRVVRLNEPTPLDEAKV